MRRIAILVAVVGVVVGVLAAPVGAGGNGVDKVPMTGNAWFTGSEPGGIRVTPGGVIHQIGGVATVAWSGDVVGTTEITYRQTHINPSGSRLIASAYSNGEVTWDGRTGPVRGASNAICKADELGGLVCGGTMVLHGSGDLEGVKFHAEWGPGGFAFPYEGFVLDTGA